MKISYERSGGFAGVRFALDLDLQNLPPQEASALERLVSESDFFHLDEFLDRRPMADGFQYAISIEDGERKHSLRVGENSVPDALRPLLDDLNSRARNQRRAR